MEERINYRLSKILDTVPALKKIMVSKIPLEKKRMKVRELLNKMLIGTFDDNPEVSLHVQTHPMDAIQQLEDPTERRGGGGLSDLVGKGFVLLVQLRSHPSLGDRIDQQGQSHDHQ